MTYGEAARQRWRDFYPAWLRGWNREPLRDRASEYETQAHNAGRRDRQEACQIVFDMLTERGTP